MKLKVFGATIGALIAGTLFSGCDSCRAFVNRENPEKYQFRASEDETPQDRDMGPFIVAMYRDKNTDPADAQAAVQNALTALGEGGSVSNSIPSGMNPIDFQLFGLQAPYGDAQLPISFESTFEADEKVLDTEDSLVLVWKGLTGVGYYPINRPEGAGKDGKTSKKYPTLAGRGKRFTLKVPMTTQKFKDAANVKLPRDPEKEPIDAAQFTDSQVQIIVSKLGKGEKGGFKFNTATFEIRRIGESKKSDKKNEPGSTFDLTKAQPIPINWKGDDDAIYPNRELEQKGDAKDALPVDLMEIKGFKGDVRRFQCHLLTHPVDIGKESKTLDIKHRMSNMWFVCETKKFLSGAVISASGSLSGVSGTITKVSIKLEGGGDAKILASREEWEKSDAKATEHVAYEEHSSDEETRTHTFRCQVRVEADKIPKYVEFVLEIGGQSRTERAEVKKE